MRPSELIVTHANADFDALGSALAARRLYPGAVIRLPGGVNRNVRAFIALHADELAIPDPAQDRAGRCRAGDRDRGGPAEPAGRRWPR